MVEEALNIHDAQDIMQEDQRLFDETIAELKKRVALSLLDLLDPDQDE